MRVRAVLLTLLGVSALAPAPGWAELKPETLRAWDTYRAFTEARVDAELASDDGFLVLDFLDPAERSVCREQARSGAVCILKRETIDDEGRPIPIPDGMVHHWYGSVLVPGVGVTAVLDFVKAYERSADVYPEVEASRVLAHDGNDYDVFLRLRRTKVITVHYNTQHDVHYRDEPGSHAASSRSVATRIREIANPGEPNESEKAPGQDRGYLWGLRSYWRFLETDEGTIVECETISLSRRIPVAARWLVKNFVDSVPRESLESTLLPMREQLGR